VLVLNAHTVAGPVITGAGVGCMVIVLLMVESQLNELVCVKVTDPAPAPFHLTLIIVSVAVFKIVPPVTIH
jgi:hypothetical protein